MGWVDWQMECSSEEVGLNLVAHLADWHFSSAVAVEFEWESTGNETEGKTVRNENRVLTLMLNHTVKTLKWKPLGYKIPRSNVQ